LGPSVLSYLDIVTLPEWLVVYLYGMNTNMSRRHAYGKSDEKNAEHARFVVVIVKFVVRYRV